MKKIIILATVLVASFGVKAQIDQEDIMVGQSCTSIMVGKDASEDGSVMTSHTCDGRYRTWMSIEPAQDHQEGAMHIVYRGTMHTAFKGDTTGVRIVGQIPEVKHTYAYLNTAYPCMNEKQLSIGESTFGGPDTLYNDKGMFTIEELQRVALQRCDNAREAIKLIGQLIKQYGYGDGGECITIADKQEVWQMEIIGAGKNVIGGVWVAKRVADDEVAVSCNIPRIGKIDRNSKDFMCSDNVEQVAKDNGLWDGKGEFVFWKAYNCDYAKGKNFLEREWFILSTLAPNEKLTMDMPELPFSVKPQKKVSAREVMQLLRSTYEGTQYDMCKNLKVIVNKKDSLGNAYKDTIISPIANPWMGTYMRNTFNMLDSNSVEFHRGVSVAWCSYSFVAQMRSWLSDEVGGVVWMSVDNPAQSPRIPIFCGNTTLPKAFARCGQKEYNEDAVLWQYRKANKLATVAWQSTKNIVNNEVQKYEASAFENLSTLEDKVKEAIKNNNSSQVQNLLNNYTNLIYLQTSNAWKELEQKLWLRFGMGF